MFKSRFQIASEALAIAVLSASAAAQHHPLQLSLKLGTMLKKHFVNPLSQVHERFNGHP